MPKNVIEIGGDAELVQLTQKVAGIVDRVVEEAAIQLHLDLGFTKPQACSLMLSSVSSVMGNLLKQLGLVCEVPLSKEQLSQFDAEFETLLNKWVKQIYDKQDGTLN